MAPILVGFTTSSNTAILCAFWHIACTEGSPGLYMAHNIPLVRAKPVSFVRTSYSAVYTGIAPQRSMISFAAPSTSICLRSHRQDIGTQPASSARSMTLGLSAMKIPGLGSYRCRNCVSFNLAYISNSGLSRSVISMISAINDTCTFLLIYGYCSTPVATESRMLLRGAGILYTLQQR